MLQRHRFILGIAAIAALVFIGTTGYMLIEGWDFSDAIYMTIITLGTVGYREMGPLSAAGRAFTCFLIVGGVGLIFYVLTAIVGHLIEQGNQGVFRRRRMESQIGKIKDHFIICGYGRVGREVAADFSRAGVSFVVLDPDEATAEDARQAGFLCLTGSASADEKLRESNIEQARSLIAVTGSDAENIFITLTAKELNPEISIVARACSANAVPKLKRAGADKVVMPLRIGGRHIAMQAMRPLVIDFVDTLFGSPASPLELEEIAVAEDSRLSGKSVGEGERLAGLTILTARKRDGRLLPKPALDTLIEPGDQLVVMGRREQLEKLETGTLS